MMIVRDIMYKNFAYISPQRTMRPAAKGMIHKGIDTLFVIKNDRGVGAIGIRDLFILPVPASFGSPMKIIR
jgi:CBS domain-containing protein